MQQGKTDSVRTEEPCQVPRARGGRRWPWVVGALVCGVFAGFSIASDSTSAPAAVPLKGPTAQEIPGTGTYWVGPDVSPGLYRSRTNVGCTWRRSKDASGEPSAVIASDLPSKGDSYVLLKQGDFFDTDRCMTWRRVEDQH
ncbi:hypothetical protein ACWGQT_00020 [Streptomyces yangpuensis]